MNLTSEQIEKLCPTQLKWYLSLPTQYQASDFGITPLTRQAIIKDISSVPALKEMLVDGIFTDMIYLLIKGTNQEIKAKIPNAKYHAYTRLYDGIIEQLKKGNRIFNKKPDDFNIVQDDYIILGHGGNKIWLDDLYLFCKEYKEYTIFLHKDSVRKLCMSGFETIADCSDSYNDRVEINAMVGIKLYNIQKHYMFKD